MSHLKSPEMSNCLDAMYQCLFGDDMHQRWKHLKRKTKLDSEREFVGWILGFAEKYADIDVNSDENEDEFESSGVGVVNMDVSCSAFATSDTSNHGNLVDDDDDDDVTTRLARSFTARGGVKQEVVEETVAGNLEYGCDVIFDAAEAAHSAVAEAVAAAEMDPTVAAVTSLTEESGSGGGSHGETAAAAAEYDLLKQQQQQVAAAAAAGQLTITVAEAEDGSHTYRYETTPGGNTHSFIPCVSAVDTSGSQEDYGLSAATTAAAAGTGMQLTPTSATATTTAQPQIIRIQMTQTAPSGDPTLPSSPVTMLIPFATKQLDDAMVNAGLPVPHQPEQQNTCIADFPVAAVGNSTGKKVAKGFIYPCNLCSAKFRDRYSLKGHIGVVHSQGKLHKCKFCVMVFHSRTDRIKHEAVKHTLHRHACDICGKTFSQSRNILPHKRAVHYVEKYACDMCDVSYARQSHLKEHMKRIHDGLRFKCNICSQTFATKQNVRRHMFVKHDIGGDETEFI